jgi:hypothetical protein
MAHSQARAALDMLQPLFAKQSNDHGLLLDMATATLLLADASGNTAEATQLRKKAWNMTQAVHTGGNDPRLLALQVEALLGLQRKTEARLLIERLWKSGYGDPALRAVLRHAGIDYPVNAAFARRIDHIMQSGSGPVPPMTGPSSTTGTTQ